MGFKGIRHSDLSCGINRLFCEDAGLRGFSSLALADSVVPAVVNARDILLMAHFETLLGRCDGIESLREISAKLAIALLR